MECDSGFSFLSSSAGLWEGVTPDPRADAEKILQEAKEQDKPADEDDTKVKVDSAFRKVEGMCGRDYTECTKDIDSSLFPLAWRYK